MMDIAVLVQIKCASKLCTLLESGLQDSIRFLKGQFCINPSTLFSTFVALVEQVKTNIKESRRLIILMAKSVDKWLFEQQVGLHDALLCDEVKVILIELEHHDDYSDFSESMRHIIQKKGTIKWTKKEWTAKSPSSNSKFWKQVRYNMSSRSPQSQENIHLI